MAKRGPKSCVDVEAGPHRASAGGRESDDDLCFADAEERSWHSPYSSGCANFEEVEGVEEACRDSCVSDCSFEGDLEGGAAEIKAERDCRICQLSLESRESGISIVLGCSCKDDLAAAHKLCAEKWFKIKGNKTCEICGSTAKNVVGAGEVELIEHPNERSNDTVTLAPSAEIQSFWQGHRFLNFLLACMIFAFVISWLFHFNVPG